MKHYFSIKKLYLWQGLNGVKQSLIAQSLSDAKQILLQREEYFFKLTFKSYITRYSFKKQELIIITKQLATMLKVGLPIIECLALLAEQHPIHQWQWLLTEIKLQIMKGDQLSESLSHYPYVFPAIYKEIVATGELTGQLEDSFETLAYQLENNQKLHKKVRQAMRYPLFLLSISLIVTLIMLLLVLPKFAEVYESFNAQLPLFTQMVIALSNTIKEYYLALCGLFMIIVLFYKKYIQKYHQESVAKYLLKSPIIGKIITYSCLTQIFQTLFITQKSAIPLLTGLATAQKTTQNILFQHSLLKITNSIEQGQSFSQAISKYSLYPNLCVQLIRVGEESGTLELMLQRLAEFYQQNSIELADNLSQKIEPLMMLLMAIIIGSLVIAMYLPVFQLSSVIR
ncbi:protein transport protein HofC [Orbus mooreae]|uniref:protein transport protein HofC n=1 Tax=Orbus mooreae TaxID=3074107 RepID=UPI00370DC528